jgi:hypothetical protein
VGLGFELAKQVLYCLSHTSNPRQVISLKGKCITHNKNKQDTFNIKIKILIKTHKSNHSQGTNIGKWLQLHNHRGILFRIYEQLISSIGEEQKSYCKR